MSKREDTWWRILLLLRVETKRLMET